MTPAPDAPATPGLFGDPLAGWSNDDILLTRPARARLMSEPPGLWLREPCQFLHDAMPRAEAFLDRFPQPPAAGSGPDYFRGVRTMPMPRYEKRW